MTVFIDKAKSMGRAPRNTYCHMMTDGDLEELHEAAEEMGLKKEWFQDHPRHPHYDVIKPKWQRAVKNGAIPVSTRELLTLCGQV